MNKTVGSIDRAVRAVLAVGALIGAGFAGFSSGWGIVLIVVAAILAITGSSGYCPLYSATGVSTLDHDETSSGNVHAR